MAISQTLTDTFLQDCLDGAQNLGDGGDTLKIALYTSSATLGATTSAYTATNEVSGTGYTAGGATLASQAVAYDATNQVAFFDAADPAFTTATFSPNFSTLLSLRKFTCMFSTFRLFKSLKAKAL